MIETQTFFVKSHRRGRDREAFVSVCLLRHPLRINSPNEESNNLLKNKINNEGYILKFQSKFDAFRH